MLETPVLLIIFNRPDITRKTVEQIKKVKPKRLYIAADGPRSDKPDDLAKCQKTRSITEQIDWACELKTLFHEVNKGCGYGPVAAIDWFFSEVEFGIILEDDCIPDESFFYFCEELLTRFKDDHNVSMIAGTNPFVKWKAAHTSYMFSNMAFSWGWATWQRSWHTFDYTAEKWSTEPVQRAVKQHLKRNKFYIHFKEEFNHYFKEERQDVWDMQWLFARFQNQSYSIIPTQNLISNVGFTEDSTHTFDESINIAHLNHQPISFPLTHPKMVKTNTFFEWYLFERFINPKPRSFVKKVLLKILKSFLG
ncbi:hypothetical protein [Spirosoma rigui]|uniref:hypothetical protein n=1 Tax=Spirosoma rigui TaxID=564064 RepID=UPI0009AF7DD7|nr:hypothetical protein [Spirosoma rigui]